MFTTHIAEIFLFPFFMLPLLLTLTFHIEFGLETRLAGHTVPQCYSFKKYIYQVLFLHNLDNVSIQNKTSNKTSNFVFSEVETK